MLNERRAGNAADAYAIVHIAPRESDLTPAPERPRWRRLAAVLPGLVLAVAAAIGGAEWS